MRIHRSLGVETLVALMAARRENEPPPPRPCARFNPGSATVGASGDEDRMTTGPEAACAAGPDRTY